ncbi:hypothetical protein MTR67_053186 [Solanum verrucosum]|uniref:SAWADEE domain-containing protein n=1 Tax=Solanum verrucosum TaxID=315347 RepID=A0AAF0VAG1_SOLVR|nr:hypothetical protein MTR67_053186 [Solanum verrucosum]
MKKSDGNPAKYDLEHRYKGDDSWYGVLVTVDGETMTVKFEGYSEKFDVKFLADDFKSKEEIDEFVRKFRNVSPQLQDNECGSVKEGMIVCAACNAFGKDDMLFYDAVVEALFLLHSDAVQFSVPDVEYEHRFSEGLTHSYKITKIIESAQNFSLEFGQSIQYRLTRSGMDPTPTPTSCRHGCVTKSEESEQLRKEEVKIHNENHTFHNGGEECVCTFVLSWLHGPKKDDLANSGIEGICIIKGTAQVDPRISSFLELANQKLRKSSCKSTSTSEQDNSASKGSFRTKRVRYLSSEQKSDSSFKASYQGISSAKNAVDVRCTTEATDSRRHWDHDKDLGGQCSNYHLMLVENLERTLFPSSLRDFIHKHTSVWSQAYISPCPSYMPYARGIIVVDCEEKLKEINHFLDNPTHLVVSSKGRPMVISERDMRQSMIKTSLGSLMYSSQDIYQAKSICQDLIIVHSGSEAYRKANQAKDLFLEFMSHQQRLYKKLASEERLFLQMLQLQPHLDLFLF